ncbi:MAG: hypothetical protein ACM3RP_13695 [Chitinophagales bacterium]
MVKGREGEGFLGVNIKARVRFDFRGRPQAYRLFHGAKRATEVAAETRERELALLRNLPLQGIRVLEVDTSPEVYQVSDPVTGEEVGYAPVIIEVEADAIEDLVRFILREEFRKIEVLEPAEILLSHWDAERFLYRMGEEMKQQITVALRRMESGR